MNTDSSAEMFLGYEPDPLRYEHFDDSPYEAHALVARLIPNGSRVLDIGCGTAMLGSFLDSSKNIKYEGLEPMPERADKAKAKGFAIYNNYLSSSVVSQLPRYDVVVLADVIEHLSNPYSIIKPVKSIMKSSGCLIVSVPNIAHWSIRCSLAMGKFDYADTGILDATHLRWFTIKSFEAYLKNCGLIVKEKKFTSGFGLAAYKEVKKYLSIFLAERHQRKIVSLLVKLMPKLFACQIICKCELR